MIGQRLLSQIETDYLESVGQALPLEIIGSYLTLRNELHLMYCSLTPLFNPRGQSEFDHGYR